MEEVLEGAVELIVTSPPYGQIKDYANPDQIGFGEDFESYFARLKRVWQECVRVLAPQGRLVINVGDQYLRAKDYGRYRILPISATIIHQCMELGLDYLGDIIWQKISTTNTTGGCSLMGSLFYPRNGLVTYDYEHILIFKKPTGKDRPIPRERKEFSKICLDEWKRWFVGHWTFPGVQQKEHIAMFPEEIPYRLIRMFSVLGDLVLDPFAGSGTTLKVAANLGRQSIGFEVNPEYIRVMKEKIQEKYAHSDYHAVLQKIYHRLANLPHIQVDYEFSSQKAIICLTSPPQKSPESKSSPIRVVIDFMLLPPDLPLIEMKRVLSAKSEENTIQAFLAGTKEWAHVQKYILLIAPLVDLNVLTQSKLLFPARIEIVPFDLYQSASYSIEDWFIPR
jgi:DNA modification methylase